MMLTRKEKRIRRQKLIRNLQQLEIQHQLIDGPEVISSQCEGCDICTKIRAIGEELSPSNIDICTASGLTVGRYHEMCKKDMSDKEIAIEIKVSEGSLKNWKKTNNIIRKRSSFELSIKKYTRLREKGMTYGDIAEKLNCSLRVLTRWIKKNNASDIKRGKKA